MSASKIIFNWLLTVIFGSIISVFLIFFHQIIFEGDYPNNSLFTFILLLILISFIFSIPTVFVLKLSADYILKSAFPKKKKILYLHIIHILCSLGTFACIVIGFDVSDILIFIWFTYLFVGYTTLGVILWNRILNQHIKK